ncbi:homoserine kinase [Amphibacillus xylanus]|uniref:Homoserine kinase n=1 Tax=Amphibacillus xylanus (strain ATCC 51415 / DSM 6626 / JCM 7361 / LMG 17667 / NBRC 15112 / Ep01) TaxID=698758 RepID=K0IX62_AMPXN|nr:homoserine kinase [Amphibacillus xylanus]BAM46974.1 homoserine kinase [Amphibacillus xylanus NBRC 15112]
MTFMIKVPATTANIGAGFDSIGIALNLYLTLKVKLSDKLEFVHLSEHLNDLPTDESNFIYQIAKKTADRYQVDVLPPCRIEVTSDIPFARGLGSSATAIVAGIELANQLLQLNLTADEKVLLATEIEGHPDNVAPAVLGGCVIGHYDQTVETIHVPINNLTFVTIIPDFELKTKDARAVLPKQLSHSESVKASSIANVSVAAICQQNWPVLGRLVSQDLFHQPYRKQLIPHYDQVEKALIDQVYGLYLSGAGPTMIALASEEQAQKSLAKWKREFPQLKWLTLQAVNQGVFVK